MRRLYSNPNAWRRTSNFGRITQQQLDAMPKGSLDVDEAKRALVEQDEAVVDRHARRVVREMLRIKPLMEARRDKRRRPRGVSKEAFKLYRKLRLKLPAKKAKKPK